MIIIYFKQYKIQIKIIIKIYRNNKYKIIVYNKKVVKLITSIVIRKILNLIYITIPQLAKIILKVVIQ
jgi:hypothetical protein